MGERPLMVAQRGGLGLATAPTPAPALAPPSVADWLLAFWQLDRELPFSAAETRLYCYWLTKFHAADWPAVLTVREPLIAAHVNMSAKVFESAWIGLLNRGLLTYEAGADGRAASWGLPTLWPDQASATTTPSC